MAIAWKILDDADERDIALWAQDSAPVSARIRQATGKSVEGVSETTLKVMANIEYQRRARKRERIWWIVATIVGIVASFILAAIGARP